MRVCLMSAVGLSEQQRFQCADDSVMRLPVRMYGGFSDRAAHTFILRCSHLMYCVTWYSILFLFTRYTDSICITPYFLSPFLCHRFICCTELGSFVALWSAAVSVYDLDSLIGFLVKSVVQLNKHFHARHNHRLFLLFRFF